jgi:hypothetical protein
MMLLAVPAASPLTIKREGRYRRVKGANRFVIRYKSPATLARTRGDVSAVRVAIGLPPQVMLILLYRFIVEELWTSLSGIVETMEEQCPPISLDAL